MNIVENRSKLSMIYITLIVLAADYAVLMEPTYLT